MNSLCFCVFGSIKSSSPFALIFKKATGLNARHFLSALGETKTRKAGHEVCMKVDIVAFLPSFRFGSPRAQDIPLIQKGMIYFWWHLHLLIQGEEILLFCY
jgi:hypothetical protein